MQELPTSTQNKDQELYGQSIIFKAERPVAKILY